MSVDLGIRLEGLDVTFSSVIESVELSLLRFGFREGRVCVQDHNFSRENCVIEGSPPVVAKIDKVGAADCIFYRVPKTPGWDVDSDEETGLWTSVRPLEREKGSCITMCIVAHAIAGVANSPVVDDENLLGRGYKIGTEILSEVIASMLREFRGENK